MWHLGPVGQLVFSAEVAVFYIYYSKILKYLALLLSLLVFLEKPFRIPWEDHSNTFCWVVQEVCRKAGFFILHLPYYFTRLYKDVNILCVFKGLSEELRLCLKLGEASVDNFTVSVTSEWTLQPETSHRLCFSYPRLHNVIVSVCSGWTLVLDDNLTQMFGG